MLRKFGSHLRDQWIGSIALFLVLGGGTAWAVDGPLAGQNTVGSEDIINNDVKSTDIADGKIFNVDLADSLITGQKIKDDTLTGADIDESSLGQVPSAQNAITLNGKTSQQLGSGRIHLTGVNDNSFHTSNPLPGVSVDIACGSGAQYPNQLSGGVSVNETGTANAMIVASGIDPGPGAGADFEVSNGAQDGGLIMHPDPNTGGSDFNFRMRNATGPAHAEWQIIIDTASKTYSLALHMYDDQGYCETFGTATVAD